MRAIVVSDIYGKHGRPITYMTQWETLLNEWGYEVQLIYLDELYPDAYIDSPFCKAQVHEKFIADGIDQAVKRLRQILISHSVDLLLGFSLGGLLASLVRTSMQPHSKIICISATRLRFYQNLEGNTPLHIVFGEEDPFRPSNTLMPGGECYEHIVIGGTHEIYLDIDSCRFLLNDILSVNKMAPPDFGNDVH